MRILITGGTGSVGRTATARLVEHGWEVRVIGRRQGIEIPGAEYASCDVTDTAAVREQVRGCEAVVHLAAVPSPGGVPGPELFRINATGTFNVFAAAEAEGIRRVVQASSINAHGGVFGTVDLDHVAYLPLDEEHPTYTTDAYSFSKNVVEAIGDYYWRRSGIASVALRLPYVRPAHAARDERRRHGVRHTRAHIDAFAALPEAERRARLDVIRRAARAFRAQRPFDHWPKGQRPPHPKEAEDPLFWIYNGARFDFWTCVDARDSAQAIEKALTATFEGSHVLYITDRRNTLDMDAETLARLFFADVTRRSKPLEGNASLISIDKARALIGFEPEYPVTIRDA